VSNEGWDGRRKRRDRRVESSRKSIKRVDGGRRCVETSMT
jgi:hypothetical protein